MCSQGSLPLLPQLQLTLEPPPVPAPVPSTCPLFSLRGHRCPVSGNRHRFVQKEGGEEPQKALGTPSQCFALLGVLSLPA